MSYHRKWMKEFLERLIQEDLDVIWSCYAAVNTVDKEMLQLMKKAGCWNIFFGFETAVEELAKNMLTNRKNRHEIEAWGRRDSIPKCRLCSYTLCHQFIPFLVPSD